MGIKKILQREKEQIKLLMTELESIPSVHILEHHKTDRLGIVSFCVDHIHYNLIVRLLNDRFGFQVRGGCSCAGTYGHYLLHIDLHTSKQIADNIDHGDMSNKPGWVRVSLHPIMTNDEISMFICALKEIIANIDRWKKDYVYDSMTNDYFYINHGRKDMSSLFRLE